MGTRIERATGPKLAEKAQAWKGEHVQVVTWEGKAYSGTLESVSSEVLSLVDPNAYWYNKKRHTHTLSIPLIRELILDKKSLW